MINENEFKFPMKIGCMFGVLFTLTIPYIIVKTVIETLTENINTEEYFTSFEGIVSMLVIFSFLLGIVLLFKLLDLKSTFLKLSIIIVLSISLFVAEATVIKVTQSYFIKVVFILVVIVLKAYYIFFRKFRLEGVIKIVSFFRKKDLSKIETFSLRAKKGNITIKNPFAGIYVQGGAGSGKTESVLKPIIKQGIEQNFAYILYDFKGDLNLFEKQILENKNIYDSFTLNFREPLKSNRFNPINPNFLNNPAEVFELSKTLFYNLSPGAIKQSNNYFLDEAINFFTAVVIYFKNNHKDFCTIPHIISAFSQVPLEKMIPLIGSDIEALPYISSLKNVLELGANKQLAGVTGTLQGNLAKFSSKELFWVLSGNDFTPDINNPEDIKRLTIINNSVLPGFYGPLIAMIINVCLKNMNDQGKHKSVVYLDEAPTLYIPEFEQIPATARSNKIATVYACQDYMQIVDKYGREKAQTIISNLSSQFFGRTTNVESIKLISELFGKYDKRFETESRGSSSEIFDFGDMKFNRNTSESFQERSRVTSNELTNLKPGEFYSITGVVKKKKAFKTLPKIKTKKEESSNMLTRLTSYATEYDLESNYLAIYKTIERIFK